MTRTFTPQTAVIATLGPATWTPELRERLVEAGVRIFRLNFSHGTAEDFAPVIRHLRQLEDERGLHLCILQDLAGPKLRTCDHGAGTIELSRGQEIRLCLPERAGDGDLCFDHPEILRSLAPGDPVALSDGMIRFEVAKAETDCALLRALSPGLAPPRKGIAFPGKRIPLAALTAGDRRNLKQGLELGVDAVALSYVRSAEDIADARSVMQRSGREIPVVAKMERAEALENIDEIIQHADAIMVARGDLGLETPLASLPGLQKRLIRACNRAGKPVVVATQMLLSMVRSPMPSRAETTDIANAVLDGADCLMLSEETAIGDHPVEAVRYMQEIAREAEAWFFGTGASPVRPPDDDRPDSFLAYSACLLAEKSRATALVAHTVSGQTARNLAACRPEKPILALCPDAAARRFLNLSRGVRPVDVKQDLAGHLERAEAFVETAPEIEAGDTVVITAGQPRRGRTRARTNIVKIHVKEP